MGSITPAKMKGPDGISSMTVEGHQYEVDKDGVVKVAIQDHVPELRRHGFEDYLDDRELDKDIEGMDRDELTEFIEERGGDVEPKAKMKDLRKQAKKLAAG